MKNYFVLLAYVNLAVSRTVLHWLLACMNFTLDSEDLLCRYKWKVISMSYGSSTSSWKPWRSERLDIYINPQKYIYQMITKTILISTRIVKLLDKTDIPFWVWRKVSGKWDNILIRISQWRESHCRTNIRR